MLGSLLVIQDDVNSDETNSAASPLVIKNNRILVMPTRYDEAECESKIYMHQIRPWSNHCRT